MDQWLGRWTSKQEVPGSSSPPCHWMDLSSVAPNSPFPSSGLPLSQNESSCKTFHVEMSLICISLRMVSHLNSF